MQPIQKVTIDSVWFGGWVPNLKSKFNSNFSPSWLGRVPCFDPLPHLHKLFSF